MTYVRLAKDEKYKLNNSERLILFYRQHPVIAAKDLLGVDLAWYQRKVLRSLWFKKNNLVLMSRGIGKTWLLALFAVLYAMLYPKVKIGILTPSFKQTDFLFEKIADFFEDSAFFRASVKGKLQRTTFKDIVRFHNRSFIEGLPLGTGQKVRGRRYNVVLIDEYAQVGEDIVKMVIRPMMNVKQKDVENKYVISSTAYYTWNHFYLQYLMYNILSVEQPEKYGLSEYTVDDLKLQKDPPFEVDDEVYEMMKMDTIRSIYLMENLCIFPVENIGFFSQKLIDACTPETRVNSNGVIVRSECPIETIGDDTATYVMGVDAARALGGDNFAIVLLKLIGGQKQVVRCFTLNGKTYQAMVSAIRKFISLFNVVQINMDSGGGGTTLKDLLAVKHVTETGETQPPIYDMDDKDTIDLPGEHILRMVNFTTPVINNLYIKLKAEMQHRMIEFPIDIRHHSDKEYEEMAQEILSLKREMLVIQAEGKGNYYTFDVPSQFKKDRITALTLALRAADEFLGNNIEKKNAEPATGFWV